MNEEPIATYIEKRIRVRRRFVLYHDRLQIEGRQGVGSRFELQVPLAGLRLPKATVWARDPVWQALLALPFIVLVLTTALWGQKLFPISPILFWAGVVISWGGMIASLFLGKRNTYYQYFTVAGVTAFNIGQIGNTADALRHFSELVEQQIETMKKTNKPPDGTR